MLVPVNRNRCLVVFAAVFILFGIAVAYQPVMFNFFISDDFHYLAWFHDNRDNPTLFLEQNIQHLKDFHLYYRPVINSALYCEYLIWGPNSCAFRLMSVVLYILTMIVMGLLAFDLAKDSRDPLLFRSRTSWCFISVGLFALYPLHTEPINWVVAQTEVLSNLFAVLSLWSYLIWRRNEKWYLEFISCVFAGLAFFTKEATVALPVTLFAYELLMRHSETSVGAKSGLRTGPN